MDSGLWVVFMMCFLSLVSARGQPLPVNGRGSHFASDPEGVDTSNAAGRIVAGVLASLAELAPAQWATVRRNDIDLVGIEAVR